MPKTTFIVSLVSIAVTCSFCNADKTNIRTINIQNEKITDCGNVIFSHKNDFLIMDRINVPDRYIRENYTDGSFQKWLRLFPVKPIDTPVYLYNGMLKNRQDVHATVLNIDTGTKDLQQCADAVMRLRAEYLYQKKAFDSITFTFTNGTKASYSKWRAGFRPLVNGNNVTWSHTAAKDTSNASFRKYMNTVFMYCGTHSLEQELSAVPMTSIQAGDVLIHGGFPGHAMIVVDVAVHKTSGKKIFLLAQSYMPAQDMHIVNNFNDDDLSPWYEIPEGSEIETPEWTFEKSELKRFR